MKTSLIVRYASMIVIGWVSAHGASAAVFNWSGAASSNWTASANWVLISGTDPDGVPDADDDVILPPGPTYTGGVYLNGNQACNSLTLSNITAFTIGGPGQTLTIASGALNRRDITGTEPQHKLTCDLVLSSPDGTNTCNIEGSEAYNAPTQEVLAEGKITAAGRLRKIGSTGKLTLANTNSFGAAPLLESGTLEVKGVLVSEALGSGTLSLSPSTKLYVRNLSQTIANPLAVSAAGTAPLIASYNCAVTLTGTVDVPSGRSFQFGHSDSSLIVLSNTVTGAGNLSVMRSGTAFTSTNQFTPGNLNVGQAGGSLVLDGVSWTTFTNYYSGGYGSGNRQWQLGGGGFSARTTPLTITGAGAVGGGANAKTWFNRTVNIGGGGYSLADSSVRLYANAPVIIAVDTELTGRYDWYSVSSAGPGLNGTHNNAVVNRFAGNITDQVAAGTGASRGVLRFNGVSGNDEIILAGTNDWTGSYSQSGHYVGATGTYSLNSGPGGLMTGNAAGLTMLIQFDGNASLPRGNGGSNAWLAATSRNSGWQGFLFTARSGGEVYTLRPGYKFILGSNGHTTYTIGILGGSGPAGSSATLQDSAACIHSGQAADPMTMDFLVRGPSEFVVGSPGAGTNGALLLQPSCGFDAANYDSGVGGAATVVSNTAASRTIRKRGDGTLVLRHVDYTKIDGTGDTSAQFVWQIGLSSGLYFDGAVRETGDTLENSTTGFPLYIYGGVLELGYTNFMRTVSPAPTAGQVKFFYAGGFSAYGADRRVNLSGGALFDWGNTGAGYTHSSYPLVFGSRTANATLIFENNISLGTTGQRLLATVRGTGSGPEGRITGQITGAGAGLILTNLLTRLNEAIPAGTLELAHTNNTFTGAVDIYNSTLLVNGGIRAGTAALKVYDGGTLGGTGSVVRPVTVSSNGTLMAGGAGAVGVLTLTNSVTLSEGARLQGFVSGGAAGVVQVGGLLTLPTNAAVAVTNLTTGGLPASIVLLQANGPLAGATDLSGWTVSGIGGAVVTLRGNSVLLKTVRGTVISIR
jgi:fibronectin-binding autotransporter adhesin